MRIHRGSRPTLAALIAATTLFSVAGFAGTADAAPPVGPSAELATASTEKVLDVVQVGDSTLQFVEHGSIGIVGVYEVKPLGSPSVLAELTADGAAPSGLELLAELNTPTKVAAVKVATSAQVVGTPAQSGAKVIATRPQHVPGSSCVYADAFIAEMQWAQNWYFDHQNDWDVTAQQGYDDLALNGTTGKVWNAATSQQRTMAACNGGFDGYNAYAFNSAFEFSPEVRVNGSWHGLTHVAVDVNEEAIYYSGHGPQTWRLRIRECVPGTPYCNTGDSLWHDMGVGIAIDRPLPLVAWG